MLLVHPNGGRIVKANLAAAILYGYDRGALEAMSIADLDLPSGNAAPARDPEACEVRLQQAADGSRRTVKMHPAPITCSDTTLLFCILHDLTEHATTARECESLATALGQREVLLSERTRQLDETMQLLRQEMGERRRIETDEAFIREKLENQERSRVARDIHDGIGQSLQAVKLQLKMRQAHCKAGNACGGYGLNEVIREITTVSTELREIILSLRPLFLEETDLDVAVRALCERTSKRTSIKVRAEWHGNFRSLPSPLKLSVYRICQEALANIVKHARSESALIRLEREPRALTVVIRDDGIGGVACPTMVSQEGSGLTIMRERVELLNGSFTVISPPGMGTVINVEVPLT